MRYLFIIINLIKNQNRTPLLLLEFYLSFIINILTPVQTLSVQNNHAFSFRIYIGINYSQPMLLSKGLASLKGSLKGICTNWDSERIKDHAKTGGRKTCLYTRVLKR